MQQLKAFKYRILAEEQKIRWLNSLVLKDGFLIVCNSKTAVYEQRKHLSNFDMNYLITEIKK